MDDEEEDIELPLAPLAESTAMSLLWEEMDVTREPPMERSDFDVSRPIRPIQEEDEEPSIDDRTVTSIIKDQQQTTYSFINSFNTGSVRGKTKLVSSDGYTSSSPSSSPAQQCGDVASEIRRYPARAPSTRSEKNSAEAEQTTNIQQNRGSASTFK